MIARSNIEKNIRQLATLYNSAKNPKKELYYSKLAVLELCGWIEESMDDIVVKCCNRTIKEARNKKYIREKVVDKNYGFEYERHFKNMLATVIGLSSFEKLERQLDPVKLAQLKSTLGSLKGPRNSAAHTHIKGVAASIDAPSVTLQNFTLVFDGLKNIETNLRTMGL